MFTASFQKLTEIDTGGGSAEYLCITWTEGINRKPPVLTMSHKSIIHYKKKEKDSGGDLGKPPNHSDAFTNCTNFKDLISQFKAPTRSWIIPGIHGQHFPSSVKRTTRSSLSRSEMCCLFNFNSKTRNKEAREKMWAMYAWLKYTVRCIKLQKNHTLKCKESSIESLCCAVIHLLEKNHLFTSCSGPLIIKQLTILCNHVFLLAFRNPYSYF